MKNYQKIMAVVAAGIASAATTSQATLVQVLDGALPISTSSATTADTVSGTPLQTMFSNPPQVGNLTSYVMSGDALNPFAGGLTFAYVVSETGSTVVDSLSLVGYGGLSSVYFGYSGSGINPYNISLDQGVVTIDFTGLSNGNSSSTLFVYTSATSSADNIGNVNDGAVASSGLLAPVPEPTTIAAGALMLLPFGIGALRSLRKDQIA